MMTISSKDGITDEREVIPGDKAAQGLYPDAISNPDNRPFRFD